MARNSRERELEHSLMTLQGQFNEMVRTKDEWRRKYREAKDEKMELIRGFDSALSSKNEEIERLTKLLSRATKFEAPSTTLRQAKGRKDAKGTQA